MTTNSVNETPDIRQHLDVIRRTVQVSPPLLALLLAIGLFIIGGILRDGFANPDQAINIVRLAAFLGIIAAGQTLVIISGGEGIDLSAGAVVTLGAILTYSFSDGENSQLIPALAVALGAGAVVGLVNGLGIVVLRIPPLVMTLGMAGVVEGAIQAYSTKNQLLGGVPPLMSDFIPREVVLGIPGVIFLWLIFGLLMWLLLERTSYGRNLFAIGVNRTTARLSGVRVPLVVIMTYTLAGLLAAFGGFVLLGFTGNVFINLGQPYLFPAIAAVVVGGTLLSGGKGGYWGTMAGALVLTLIDSLLRALGIEEAYQFIVLGVTLVALLSLYGRQKRLRL